MTLNDSKNESKFALRCSNFRVHKVVMVQQVTLNYITLLFSKRYRLTA